jgi:hypothetical protein
MEEECERRMVDKWMTKYERHREVKKGGGCCSGLKNCVSDWLDDIIIII